MENIEQLKDRTTQIREQRTAKYNAKIESKVRKPFYTFIPKAEKEIVNWIDEDLIVKGMEGGRTDLILEVLGVIANLKRISGQISENQQNALNTVVEWYEKSKIVDEAMNGG